MHGDTPLSHGSDAFKVRDEADEKVVERPLMANIPDEPNLHPQAEEASQIEACDENVEPGSCARGADQNDLLGR